MIKRFCDLCGTEMSDKNSPSQGACQDRLKVSINRGKVHASFEIIQAVNGTSNSGDVCKHCILDALRELDDRPQPLASMPLRAVKSGRL
jgi:hypothetical protein